MLKTFLKFINFAVEIIFPPPEVVKVLRSISVDEVCRRYRKIRRFENINSIFSYKQKFIREMIHEMKYFGNKDSFNICGEVLYKEIENNNSILIPIPLSKQRLKERGFNQCEKLCDVININKDFKYSKSNLIRVRDNMSQTKFKEDLERKENVKGVFKVMDCNEFKEKNLILIDDVVTTGSTLKEAVEALRKCGPKSITAFTIAH